MSDTNNKHRGRPKGSTSTVEITLAELLDKLGNDTNTKVVVGRTWLAKISVIPKEIESQLIEEQAQPQEINA